MEGSAQGCVWDEGSNKAFVIMSHRNCAHQQHEFHKVECDLEGGHRWSAPTLSYWGRRTTISVLLESPESIFRTIGTAAAMSGTTP